MNARRTHALLALSLAVALTACSSSTSGNGGGAKGLPGMPTDAAGLGNLMQSATATVTSAHISLDVNAAGQSVSGGGDEKLAAGKLVALDLTENLPSGAGELRIIIVDGKTYAKLPASMRTSAKPYSLVTENSSNPVV
jgi:hypothetical protein